jgi:hypothetical protein
MMNIDPYASHIPILETIFSICNIKKVFEFGPGKYSTKFFETMAEKTISVELSSEKWFEDVEKEMDKNKVSLFYISDLEKALSLFNQTQNIDLTFVDGSFESRIPCIELAFDKCQVIVTHDTEMAYVNGDPYRWNSVRMKQGYFWIDVMEYFPWTSVITKDMNIVSKILLTYKKSRVKIQS